MSLRNSSLYPILVIAAALSVSSLSSCATPTAQIVRVEVTATSTVGPSPTPLPTWTPTPEPTATPMPPAHVEAIVPEVVSPLDPVPIEADFVPPAGVPGNADLSATVVDPDARVYATFELTEREGDRFRSPTMLQLPLEPLDGFWWLIVHADTELPVVGTPARFFEIAPVIYRNLTDTLPSGITMRVPVEFNEVLALGDPSAGGRVWQYGNGEVGLWWVPGAAEDLLLNSAVVALEATYAADERFNEVPQPSEVTEDRWQGFPVFEFPEVWPGADGGPAVAWVIQGPDDWLYVLRVRSIGGDEVPQLHRRVAATFAIEGGTD